jgi:hypothetical protein
MNVNVDGRSNNQLATTYPPAGCNWTITPAQQSKASSLDHHKEHNCHGKLASEVNTNENFD